MKIAIRYYTRSGNTEKLAFAIDKALSIDAKDISVPLEEKVDILFLGCSYYAFDIDESVKQFLINNKDNIGKIVCFGTSAMMKSMKKPISKVIKNLGIELSDDEFHCRGKFGVFHKDRPNDLDIDKVKEFALNITKL